MVTVLLAGPGPRASAENRQPVGQRCILILADGLSYPDILEFAGPALRGILAVSSCAVASTRVAAGRSIEAACATIGAGVRMVAPESASLSFGAEDVVGGEVAHDVFLRRTGVTAPAGSVVCTGLAELVLANAGSPYRGSPGFLGESLGRAGVLVSVVGNSDDSHSFSRPGVLVAMDRRGIVPHGEVSRGVLSLEPSAPFGLASDVGTLARLAKAQPEPGLVVVDFGDISRLARYARVLSPDMLARHKLECYRRLDALLDELLGGIGSPSPETCYILLSPRAPADVWGSGDALAPAAAAGWGFPRGLLSSEATRQPGLIASTDIAPTIVAAFGATPVWPVDGRMLVGTPAEDPLSSAARLSERISASAAARTPVLKTFIGFLIVSVLVSVASAWLGPRAPLPFAAGVRYLLVACSLGPLILLVQPAVGVNTVGWALATLVLCSLTAGAVTLWMVRCSARAVVWAAAITALAIAVDIFAGGSLLAQSLLGHSPVIGARFYGIGNEFMGVLIGAVAVGTSGLWRGDAAIWVSAGAALAAAAILGHPSLGANFGGMIAAFTAAGTIGLLGLRRAGASRLTLGSAVLVVLVLGGLLGMCMIELNAGSERATHIGVAWRALQGGERSSIVTMALRKLDMNLRLLRYTLWTRALVTFLLAFAVLTARPKGFLLRLKRDAFPHYAAFAGCLFSAGAAMLANDSGVVASATLMMMPTLSLLGYAADERVLGR
jgi:hypothetical protein